MKPRVILALCSALCLLALTLMAQDQPIPPPLYTEFTDYEIPVFWANTIPPKRLRCLLGNLPEPYTTDDVEYTSLTLNDEIDVFAVISTTHPDFYPNALEGLVSASEFIEFYEPFWGTDYAFYTLSGEYTDGTSFEFEGYFVLIGHTPGDLNADGSVDISDVVEFVSFMFNGGSTPRDMIAADVTQNDSVDIADLTGLIDMIF